MTQKKRVHSILLPVLEQIIREIANPADVELLVQRVQLAVMTVKTQRGMVYFLVGQGALPGDALAAHLFRLAYRRVMERWMEGNRGLERGGLLVAYDKVNNTEVDLSTSVYADDIGRVTVSASP